jgi:2-C-methyl-D-erythritol 4-phosphate cytidylyltransferase
MNVDVILPAGGRIGGDFAAETATEIKALLQIGEQTILERTLGALRALDQVGRIVVIGPHELTDHAAAQAADAVLPEAESGPANILRGIEWLHRSNGEQHAERVLIVTTDLPFLTSEAITEFLEYCPHHADICVPVVTRGDIESRFAHKKGVYIPLRDGVWTIGNAFLVNPVALLQNRAHIDRIFAARKSGRKMALLLGPGLIARFLCRRVMVADVVRRCEYILGCSGAAIYNCAPELAFDIDLPEEYRYAIQHMAESHQKNEMYK